MISYYFWYVSLGKGVAGEKGENRNTWKLYLENFNIIWQEFSCSFHVITHTIFT